MTTPDPLTTLTRAIAAYHGAPSDRQDVLWTRLMRLTAPVLEERDKLLTFLPKAYDWLDAHQDAADYEERTDTWVSKLQRYQQIEDVLGMFPDSPALNIPAQPTTPCATERITPSQVPLPRPP